MKHTLLLTLSVSALLAFAPAHAADTPATAGAAPASATVEGTQDAGSAADAPTAAKLPASSPEDNANTKTTEGNAEAKGGETKDTEAKDAEAKRAPAAEAPADASATSAAEATVEGGAEGDATNVAAAHVAEEAPAADAHHVPQAPKMDWSWNGPFGTFDRPSLQRGFQVYKQVCAACHSMNRVYFRNLAALGYNEDEIKSIAGEYQITDGPNDEGEMFERPGRPSDHFKSPFANDQAARSANGGALPPDLSLIVRARADGSNYVHGLLTGYGEPPAGFALNPGMHYNKYFAGHQIAMPTPLVEGSVTYDDGTTATVEQMSRDVTAFLTWASEPVMEKRKQTGLKVMLFLLVFSGLMYATKKRVWRNVN